MVSREEKTNVSFLQRMTESNYIGSWQEEEEDEEEEEEEH